MVEWHFTSHAPNIHWADCGCASTYRIRVPDSKPFGGTAHTPTCCWPYGCKRISTCLPPGNLTTSFPMPHLQAGSLPRFLHVCAGEHTALECVQHVHSAPQVEDEGDAVVADALRVGNRRPWDAYVALAADRWFAGVFSKEGSCQLIATSMSICRIVQCNALIPAC
jgi:hypothetical protein